jgi:HSP20 family molecular chaperone IbpA
MSYFYAYPDINPYPTTHVAHTFPEKSGHYLHPIPIPYLAHKVHRVFHDKDQDVHVPKTDIRETPKSFYLEVELPGIKDKSELHLRWISTRTLLVTSKIHRPEIPESEMLEDAEAGTGAGGGTVGPTPILVPTPATARTGGEGPEAGPAPAPAPAESQREERTAISGSGSGSGPPSAQGDEARKAESAAKKEPHLTVDERQIGDMMRAFNFPVDVDRDNTHAKLDAGLLRVTVPKMMHGDAKVRHIPVSIHDGTSEAGDTSA